MTRTRRAIYAFMGLLGVVAGLGVPASHAVAPTSITQAARYQQVEITGDAHGNVVKKINGQVVPESPSKALLYPYSDLEFRGSYICQDNNIGSTFPLEAAGDYLEAGASRVVLAAAGTETPTNCTNYPDSQTIHYSVFNSTVQQGPAFCWRLSGSIDTVSQPNLWRGNVQAQLNNLPPECRGDAQTRANITSSLTGAAIGLAPYSDTSQFCVMNLFFHYQIWWAQKCDTDRIGWMKY